MPTRVTPLSYPYAGISHPPLSTPGDMYDGTFTPCITLRRAARRANSMIA